MDAATFEDLVNEYLLSDSKCRMLYVFIRVEQMDAATRAEMGIEDENSGFVQVLFDAQQPLEPNLKFEQVREVADAHSEDWTLCVTAVAKNEDASLPTQEQAQGFLNDMRDKIIAGDIDDYAVFDKNGDNVMVETADAPVDEPTLN
ncbi:hypothetical protein ACFL12_04770 [Pseudomonadota bacterium]